MASQTSAQLRRVIFQLHLWVAIVLFLALVPLGLSGVGLAWPDFLNKTTNPAPHVAAGDTAGLSPSAYLDAGRAALPAGARVTGLKMPAHDGDAVAVTASNGRPGPGGGVSAFLDPATGKLLKVGPSSSPLYAWSHDFHETVMIEGALGRHIVGWLGVVLLFLSLTGLFLWWPRGAFAKAFRWKRSPQTVMNIHHLVGFWIALPLAFVSLTGIGIVWPSLAKPFVGSAGGPPAGARPQGPPGEGRPAEGRGEGRPAAQAPSAPSLTPEQAVATAMAAHPGARLAGLTLPGGPGRPGAPPQRVWRVDLAGGGAPQSVRINDRTGEVEAAPAAPAGPPGGPVRRLHGGADNIVWKWIVTLTGFAPLVLALTGLIAWLTTQGRKAKVRAETAAAEA